MSQQGDRPDDHFHSPADQEKRIREACKGDLKLHEILEAEIDVSGALPLEHRPSLWAAVQAIEAGQAEVLMVGYLDRLVRSVRVQQEIVDRVEAAGGEVLTIDFGRLSHKTAIQRLTGTFLGAVNEYVREQIAEKSAEGQRRAVAAGHFIGPVPPGYVKGADGVLAIDPATVDIAREAFERRAAGATFAEIREFLAGRGLTRTISGVRKMLASRVYVGDIRFGSLQKLDAHPAIIDRDLFARVQRMTVTAGRKGKSDRLLARQGVLCCGSCGGRMSASRSGRYPFYRCASQACNRPQTIAAGLVELVVTDAVRAEIADIEGRASAERNVREAQQALELAQSNLEAGIRLLSDFTDETAARERLAELRQARDNARVRVDQLGGSRSSVKILIAKDWERLTLEEQRAFIRLVIKRVTVSPGRGADRITIEHFRQ